MTSTASKPARSHRQMPLAPGPDQEARAAQLRAANINPRTGLAARDLAIEAYDSADAIIRAEFNSITSAMTSTLTAVSAAMREAREDKTRAILAGQATGWVKPLVALAGGIINGGAEADVDYIMTH